MALPINSTDRVWIKYTSVGVVHEIMFRLPTVGSTPAMATTKAQALATVLSQRMSNTDSFLSARRSAAGTIFSVPIPFTVVPGVMVQATWPQDPESTQLVLTGRSFADGTDVDWSFFTGQLTPAWPADNRYNPGDAAVIDTMRINFVTWVQTAGAPGEQVVTIGNSIPNVNAYVNIRQNAYWQTAQR